MTTKNSDAPPEEMMPGEESGFQRSWNPSRGWVWVMRAGLTVVWLVSWEFVAGRWTDEFFTSSPSLVARRLADWFQTGFIWPHIGITLREMILGLLLGATAGVVIGFGLGRMKVLARVVGPFVTALYSLPKLALAPLFILWFGIGLLSKVVLTALIVFFLVFYNTFAGVRDVNELYINVVRLMGGNRRTLYTKVIFPSTVAWVATGLKLAVPYALIGAIVGELISSNRGLGFVIINSSSLFDTSGVIAALVIVAAISISMSQIVDRFERRLLRWRETETSDIGEGTRAL